LAVICCLADQNGQKVRWLVWSVWFGSIRLIGDSICEASHSVGGLIVGVAGPLELGKDGWFGWKAYPMEQQQRAVEKGCGTFIL
jgi:hypothetical protein